MERHINTSSLAFDIIRGRWLLADAQSYIPMARALINRQPLDIAAARTEFSPTIMLSDGTVATDSAMDSSGKVAVVPLHGVMTKYATCESPGTIAVARALSKYANASDIVAVVLDIDSGGGAANSVMPLVEAIESLKAAGKPVIAHCDLVASAALWVASRCDLIYLDNRLSEIGSVGALANLVIPADVDPRTGEKNIQIYARESTSKNAAFRAAREGDYTLIEDELSPLVAQFQNDVKKGRPKLDTTVKGVLSGGMFISDEAVRIGFADSVKTLSESVEAAFALAEI